MNTYSILIVEDHQVYSRALLRLLSADQELNILGVVDSAEKALEQLETLKVDLVLADISLPKMSGIALVEKLRKQYPNLHTAILSGHLTPEYVQRALDAGVRGYLVKDNPGSIMEGIKRILNGELYVSAEADAM